ncbi:hypothetical protein AUP68_11676 [Ilyonectria robusta]
MGVGNPQFEGSNHGSSALADVPQYTAQGTPPKEHRRRLGEWRRGKLKVLKAVRRAAGQKQARRAQFANLQDGRLTAFPAVLV